jgi:glutamate dehydrogenase (NAD(P)+)
MDHEPYMSIRWTDDDTGVRGYLVIDSLVRGVAGGGLRMRDGCTEQEVAGLARAMTQKEAIAYEAGSRQLPVGGAKGGIDLDPSDPRAHAVLRRYLAAMRPLITTHWAFGEDLGVRQGELDELAVELGMSSTVDAAMRNVQDGATAGLSRLRRGFAAVDRGVGLAELIGGYGVACAALEGLHQLGRDPQRATAAVQGFGSMGGAAARYLADAGVSVIAVADADGLVCNSDGLDVERLLCTRDPHGGIDRQALRADDAQRPGDEWATINADILVPAATSYVIDDRVAGAIRAALVVEAANMATLASAEAALSARGVPVIPDIIANLATNAWWWWTLFGEIEPTTPAAFAQVDRVIRALVTQAFARTAPGTPLREAALAIAAERAGAANATNGRDTTAGEQLRL